MKGFTLIEFLIVFAIVIMIFMIGLPEYQNILAERRLNQSVLMFYRSLQLAKILAVRYDAIVTVCPRQNTAKCGTDWGQGSITFLDRSGRGKIQSNTKILNMYGIAGHSIQVIWKSFPNKKYLQFCPLGNTCQQNGTFQFKLHKKQTAWSQKLVVSKTGRMRIMS